MFTDKKLITSIEHTNNIELKINQRIKVEKHTGISWLEEKRAWKDNDGTRHNCWVRIAIIEKI